MAKWNKIIVSGSNVEFNDISASGNVVPQNTDGGSLGTTSLNWSDLFLDSGAVINFDSGDVTLTHAAGKLTFGGDGAVELDFNNHEMTNVDIDSGAIDGVVIGGNSAAAGSFTTIAASNDITANGNIVGDGATNLTSMGDFTSTKVNGVISGSSTSTGSFGHLMVGGGDFSSASLASAIEANAVTTYTNATDNRVVTSTGAGGINGEANLTFDGNNLLIGSTGKLYLNDAGGEHRSGDGDVLSIAGGTEIDLTATDIDINGDVDISGNTVIGGNLTVNGSTTTVASTNVTVGDAFLFLATGSAATEGKDAGLVVQSGSAVDSGSALYHDHSSQRWSVAKQIAASDTTVTPLEFVVTAKALGDNDNPVDGDKEYGVGEIAIKDNGEIWIYS